jgi:hypothetical protein
LSSATFLSPGSDSPETHILNIGKAAIPTEGDALYAAHRQRTRILDRTIRGVDSDGVAFQPYSTKGPYWYYPGGKVAGGSTYHANGKLKQSSAGAKRNKAAVTRLLNRIGVIEGHTGKTIGGVRTQNGQGIKFENYAAFKASLGRLGVDLTGPRAPHMLQALAVGVGIERSVGDELQNIALNDHPAPAREIFIGIYGEEAARASGHNEGVPGRLPRRHFLGAGPADIGLMLDEMTERMIARVQLAATLKT